MSDLVLSTNREEEECVHGRVAVDKNFAAALFGSQDLHILEADWHYRAQTWVNAHCRTALFLQMGRALKQKDQRAWSLYVWFFIFSPVFPNKFGWTWKIAPSRSPPSNPMAHVEMVKNLIGKDSVDLDPKK